MTYYKKIKISFMLILSLLGERTFSEVYNYDELISNLRNGVPINNSEEKLNFFFKENPDKFGSVLYRICCYESSDYNHQEKIINFLLKNYPGHFDEIKMKAFLFHDFLSNKKTSRPFFETIYEKFKNDTSFLSWAEKLMNDKKSLDHISIEDFKNIQENLRKPIFERTSLHGTVSYTNTFLILKNLKLHSLELEEILIKQYLSRISSFNDRRNVFQFLVYENSNTPKNKSLLEKLFYYNDFKDQNIFRYGENYSNQLLKFFINSFKNYPDLKPESNIILRSALNDLLKAMPDELTKEAQSLFEILIKPPAANKELLEDLYKFNSVKYWFDKNAPNYFKNSHSNKNEYKNSTNENFNNKKQQTTNNCTNLFNNLNKIDAKGFLTFSEWKDLKKGASEIEWAKAQLNLTENATSKQIKTAFLKLNVLYHPDKNKELSIESKNKITSIINSAYTVLKKR